MEHIKTIDCPEELRTLHVSAFCCRLDAALHILWTTPCFDRCIGRAGTPPPDGSPSLRQLCADHPEDLIAVTEALSQAHSAGRLLAACGRLN